MYLTLECVDINFDVAGKIEQNPKRMPGEIKLLETMN